MASFKHDKEKGKLTRTREELKKAEDVKLISHFAGWISGVTESTIRDLTFPEDLLDGIALCKLMMLIEGSGVNKYHALQSGNKTMDTFKARENCNKFTLACKNLGLPVTFGYDHLKSGDLGVIASTFVFLAHACALRNVGVQEMDNELKTRLGLVQKECQLDEEEKLEMELDVGKDEVLAKLEALRVLMPTVIKPEEVLIKMDFQQLLRELASAEKLRVAELTMLKNSSKPADVQHAKDLEKLQLDSDTMRATDLSNDMRFVGVEFDFLKALFPAEDVENLTVKEVHTQVILPLLNHNLQTALAPMLFQNGDPRLSQFADVVVCMDENLSWNKMVAALEETMEALNFVSHSSGKTTVWIEHLCLPSTSSLVEREADKKRVIERVGRLALVLHPYDHPTVMNSISTVFDVCVAVKQKIPVFACLPPTERTRFLADVDSNKLGLKFYQRLFWELSVEQASSSDPEQIARVLKILHDVEKTTKRRVGDAFTVPIRNWMMQVFKQEEQTRQRNSPFLLARASFHQSINQHDEARKYFEAAVQVFNPPSGSTNTKEQNIQMAHTLSSLATTMRDLGEFKEAEETCIASLGMTEELFGPSSPQALVSRAWLGDILLASRNFDKALPLLIQVLEDHKRLKSGNFEVAVAMNNLGSAYRELNDIDKARTYFEQVLQTVDKKDSALYWAVLTNCALTMEAQKDFASALKMHEESLELKLRKLGGDHPDVALSMHNLGVCLLRMDKRANRERAVQLGNNAIAIWERAYGPKHPTVVEAIEDWAHFNSSASRKSVVPPQ